MNILIYSQHFWPENFRINDIAIKLAKNNKIYVVSSWPNYNFKSKKNIFKYGTENYKNIKIIRVPSLRRSNNKFHNIIFNYLSYIIGCFFIKDKSFDNIKFDAVISYATTPIYQALPAMIYSKKRNIKFFLWVQDVWPEILKDLNIIKNKMLLRILRYSVKVIYNKSDYILAQSHKIKRLLKKENKNTFLFYNPSNIYKFKSYKFNKINQKKIIFAGNIGKAQGLEKLIFFGKYIKKKDLPIIFEIIGEGSNKRNLENLVKSNGLENIIIFKKYMNSQKLEKKLEKSSGLLVCLSKGEALSATLPAKFQTYIAYGKPIFTFRGNIVSEIISQYKIGFTLNKKNFKDCFYKFLNINNNQMYKIYSNSSYLFHNYFEINKNVKSLEKFIRKEIDIKNIWKF